MSRKTIFNSKPNSLAGAIRPAIDVLLLEIHVNVATDIWDKDLNPRLFSQARKS